MTKKSAPGTARWVGGFSVSAIVALSIAAASAETRIEGLKYPNSRWEGDRPVAAFANAPDFWETLGGYSELADFVQPSPDQDEAGSCLYMSLTGIAEWWLNRLHPATVAVESAHDLSERAYMNLPDSNRVKNWKTDTILQLNDRRELLLNRSYRFTKGYYTETASGALRAAVASTPGASYGTMYNWIDQSSSVKNGEYAPLPEFSRTVLFRSPTNGQWDTAVAPANIVETVKNALRTNKAPVQVVYNHVGYWHSVFIVGYDDDRDSGGCPFVERSIKSGSAAAAKVKAAYSANGGCAGKGVFYVRDSIYSDSSEPMYHYDANRPDQDTYYSKRIIFREYEWLRYLANHVVQVTAK